MQSSLSTKELNNSQGSDTFCFTIIKFISGRKVSSDKYFISDNLLLHKAVIKMTLFHVLVVPITLSKYVLHHVYDALGHNGTARMYWCLKP